MFLFEISAQNQMGVCPDDRLISIESMGTESKKTYPKFCLAEHDHPPPLGAHADEEQNHETLRGRTC